MRSETCPDGFGPESRLVPPYDRSVFRFYVLEPDRNGITHSGGCRLNSSLKTTLLPRDLPRVFQRLLDRTAAVGGKYQNNARRNGQQKLQQPVKNGSASDRKQDLGLIEAEPGPSSGSWNNCRPAFRANYSLVVLHSMSLAMPEALRRQATPRVRQLLTNPTLCMFRQLRPRLRLHVLRL